MINFSYTSWKLKVTKGYSFELGVNIVLKIRLKLFTEQKTLWIEYMHVCVCVFMFFLLVKKMLMFL